MISEETIQKDLRGECIKMMNEGYDIYLSWCMIKNADFTQLG